MKIWLDDIREAPPGYIWCHSVNEAIFTIQKCRYLKESIELIDCDHDLGDYAEDGGDGIKLLDYLEHYGYNFTIRLHTMNPVGRMNMQAIIQKNKWKEIY